MATLFPCKEFSKHGMSCVGNLGLLLCVNARATCALTGVPAKGAWSQFSCQERLRLSTKSWKNGWVSLNTEKPTMLTRWSATSSSRSKVNSCRARKQEGYKQRDRNRLLDEDVCAAMFVLRSVIPPDLQLSSLNKYNWYIGILSR